MIKTDSERLKENALKLAYFLRDSDKSFWVPPPSHSLEYYQKEIGQLLEMSSYSPPDESLIPYKDLVLRCHLTAALNYRKLSTLKQKARSELETINLSLADNEDARISFDTYLTRLKGVAKLIDDKEPLALGDRLVGEYPLATGAFFLYGEAIFSEEELRELYNELIDLIVDG